MTYELTPVERQVFEQLVGEAGSNGHDFGIVELIKVKGLKREALGAVLTNLTKKGVVQVWPTEKIERRPVTQYTWKDAAKAEATAKALGVGW